METALLVDQKGVLWVEKVSARSHTRHRYNDYVYLLCFKARFMIFIFDIIVESL